MHAPRECRIVPLNLEAMFFANSRVQSVALRHASLSTSGTVLETATCRSIIAK